MLKKLLPISQLWEKLRNLKKNPQPAEQNPLNQSPNLLDFSQAPSSTFPALSAFTDLKIVGSIQKLIIVLQIGFLIVFGVHSMLDRKIHEAEADVASLESSIKSYGSMVSNSESIIKRIEKYRAIKTNRMFLSDRVKYIFENSRYVTLASVNVTTSSIAVTASADNPLNFALLLNDYFANKQIKQVVLKSASYGGTLAAGSFSVEMEIIY